MWTTAFRGWCPKRSAKVVTCARLNEVHTTNQPSSRATAIGCTRQPKMIGGSGKTAVTAMPISAPDTTLAIERSPHKKNPRDREPHNHGGAQRVTHPRAGSDGVTAHRRAGPAPRTVSAPAGRR